MLILSLFCITLGCLLASACICYIGSGCNPLSDPWNIQAHADVAKVSQKYILHGSKLCDRPRDLLSASEFGCAEWLA